MSDLVTHDPEDRRDAVAVIIDEVKRMGALDQLGVPDNRAVLCAVPEGKSIEDLTPIFDKYLPKPLRRRGTATLTDVDSFVAHLDRFKNAQSAVFADPSRTAPKLTAVFDYHPAGPDFSAAEFLAHRATYAPALSEEWKAWSAKNGQLMPQADFAAFIEDRITDVIVPNLDDPRIKTFADLVQGKFATPSELLALSRGLAINVETNVKNAISTSTGEISVQYEETHRDNAGKPVQVANLFQICIPVFYAGTLYKMAVRLRYRLVGPKIHWSYHIVRPDLVFDDAFRGIVDKVREAGSVVFLGSPEA